MNYIWEVLLQGARQGIDEKAISFTPIESANPYREVVLGDMNAIELAEGPVPVNGFYRYNDIFSHFADMAGEMTEEFQMALFDILMHFLADLDLRQGLYKAEYHQLFLKRDIENGVYGVRYRDIFSQFKKQDERYVLAALLKIYKTGPSLYILTELLRALYPKSIVYCDTRAVKELFIYIGVKKRADLIAQMRFILDVFVPIDYVVRLFWDIHFGVIGTDETMEIGNFMIYDGSEIPVGGYAGDL